MAAAAMTAAAARATRPTRGRAPLSPPDFIPPSFGGGQLGARGLTGLAYTYPWTADLVTFPMASVANGLKMAHEVITGS